MSAVRVRLPPDDTRHRLVPARSGEKTIVPSSPHAPPRLLGGIAERQPPPPVDRIFFSLPPAKNAIHCPSGEKNG